MNTGNTAALRICMFAYTEYVSDPRVRREAQALAARGDHVDFLCLRQPSDGKTMARWEQIEGVAVCHLPLTKYQGSSQLRYLLSYLFFFAMGFGWITGLYLRRRYHLIQIHTMPDFLIGAALIPRLFGCKLILDIHDLMSDLYDVKFPARWMRPLVWGLRWQERLSIALAHHIITVHEPYRQLLLQRGVRPEKVSVLMNVPDERFFFRQARDGSTAQHYTDDPAPFLLVYHGSVVARHGLSVLLQALALVRQQNTVPQVRLAIYGKGDDLPRLRDISHALKLDDIVYFHGANVPIEHLPSLLRQADLGIVPNTANAFTQYVLPTKLMEYAALGIPVITAQTLVIRQYFTASMVCFFPPDDALALAQCITKLANDPMQRQVLAEQSYQVFTQSYRWSAIQLDYYALVDRLCRHAAATLQPALPASVIEEMRNG